MSEETNQEPIDLLQTNGNVESKAYTYRVTPKDSMPFYITVIATNSTSARTGLMSQHPNDAIAYIGVSEKIIQVNG